MCARKGNRAVCLFLWLDAAGGVRVVRVGKTTDVGVRAWSVSSSDGRIYLSVIIIVVVVGKHSIPASLKPD